MARDVGLVDAFQELVPEAVAFPVAMVTQLGAIWFVTVVLAVVYLYHDRRDAMLVGGLLLAGTGIWRTIKIVWPVPRPEQPFVDSADFPVVLQALFDLAVVDTGPGFPSGHAVTTTVVYLSLAMLVTAGTKRQRYAIAVFLIALVGSTRITLGVHYVTDVVAGAMIGHGLLLGSRWYMRRSRTDDVSIALSAGLVFATICAVANVLVAPISFWEFGLFGAAVVTYAWWHSDLSERVLVRFGEPF